MSLLIKGDSTKLCWRDDCGPSNAFDADGLPRWERCEHDCWNHADGSAHMLAFIGMLHGISIPDFDVWLSEMEPCKAKESLLEVRAEAMEAARSNNTEKMLRHFEQMGSNRYRLLREDFLLPKAKTGAKVRQGGAKGGAKSRETRSGAGSKRAAILAAIAAYDGPDAAKVASVARRANTTARYVRMVMAKKNTEK